MGQRAGILLRVTCYGPRVIQISDFASTELVAVFAILTVAAE